jgi:LPS export ABC transporter protein LptC
VALRLFALLGLLALALGSWFLTDPSKDSGPKPKAPAAAKLGYFLKGTVLTDYGANGAPAIRIAAERIDQVPGANDVELHNVRLDYAASSDRLWIMVGEHARVQDGGQQIDVIGNVRLQGLDRGREGPAVIRTDQLHYDVPNAVAHTDGDVRIEFSRHMLTARGLTARLNERSMQLESRVNGRFNP